MKVLTQRVHGYLDYVVVVVFLAAPVVIGFSGLPATISYALAAIHLVLTLLTAFPLGIARLIPIALHSAIEFIVSIALIALPWLLGFTDDLPARSFYVTVGAVIFVVWLLTEYTDTTITATPRSWGN